jgi:hypothetical protein
MTVCEDKAVFGVPEVRFGSKYCGIIIALVHQPLTDKEDVIHWAG